MKTTTLKTVLVNKKRMELGLTRAELSKAAGVSASFGYKMFAKGILPKDCVRQATAVKGLSKALKTQGWRIVNQAK